MKSRSYFYKFFILFVLLVCFIFTVVSCENEGRTEDMKEILFTDKAPAPVGPYSQAILAGGFIFVSGQAALNPETKEAEHGDIKSQTKRTLENIEEILKAQGLTMNDVVKCTVFLTDINDFKEMNEVYGEYFAESKPARSTVEVANLPLGFRVEIEAIALKED